MLNSMCIAVFPNMTIMKLITVFNGDNNHFFPLQHTVSGKKAKQNLMQGRKWMISSHLILRGLDYF